MMQHEKNPKNSRFVRFLREKGYYIVLSLCLVAVGVAGYVFVSTAIRQNDEVQDPSLSVPITVTDPQKESNNPSDSDKPHVKDQADTPVMGPADTDDEEIVLQPVDETVVRPVSGSVLQDHAMDRLAYNPTTKDWRVHNGIDLAAEAGQDVAAARAGTVTAVYEDDYFGSTVIIRHADGWSTHYANLDSAVSVKAGDTVAAGDIIGTVGSSAMLELAQDSHLHFEVWCNGEPMDPEDFLN